MGHPAEVVTFGVPQRSNDGKLYTLYPQGDAPNAVIAQGGGATATSVASLGTASELASNGLVHGGEFAILGGGFGTRADYNVGNYEWNGHRHMHYRFGDFAAGFPASGSSLQTYLSQLQGFFPAALFNFNNNPGSINLSIENGGPSRSGKYLRKSSTSFAETGYIEIATDANSAIPTSPNAYMCYKHRGTGNGKIVRWWRTGLGASGKNWYAGSGGIFRESDWPYDATASYQQSIRHATHWSRHEFVLHTSGSKMRVDGTNITFGVYTGGSPSTVSTLPLINSDDSGRSLEITWPNSVDSGGAFEYADIYYDFTPARVEVHQGTKREIQLVTEWTDTKITCAFNQGELEAGEATVKVYNASDAEIHSASVMVG